MTESETPLEPAFSEKFYSTNTMRYERVSRLRNEVFYPAICRFVPRSRFCATQKLIAHREKWRMGEKKPMREGIGFL
jgi:hypothetical protein